MPIDDGTACARAGRERHFVNHLRLALSLSEIRFDLAWLGAPQPPLPAWYFITTPDHLLSMYRGFGVAIEKYRTRYGDIGDVEVDPAMVRFDDGDEHG
jgi:hypothetical protein